MAVGNLRPETGDHTGVTMQDPVNYIPELYSKKILRNFLEITIYSEICNTDYEGELKSHGAKVHIRKKPRITTRGYAVGGTLTYDTPTAESTDLTIDKGVYTAFQVDDVEKAQADIDVVNMFAQSAAEEMKIEIDREVLAFMALQANAANQGTTAGALSGNIDLGSITGVGNSVSITADNAITKIVELNQCLDEQNIPSENRWLILPAWYCALLKLGDLRRADITGDGSGVIRNGMIGQVDRTTIYMSNSLLSATDGDAGTSWYVQCGTKEATTFASQITKNDTLPIPDSFGQYWRSLMSYGRNVLQDQALASLVCKKG